ncbi:MAG: TRAM domain-containing protein [Finegoldia sp.]|nr:TRAM domain-containing protein [Finegoldia sp.]
MGTVALIVSLIIATLITIPILNLELTGVLKLISVIIIVLIYIFLSIIGIRTALGYKDELHFLKFISKDRQGAKPTKKYNGVSDKIVDTSVIIDGRIVDILATGFLEGNLYIPNFVIEELQHIADSENDIRRVKGRRGLDILKNMQNDYGDRIIVTKKNYKDIEEVDSKLLSLAKDLDASLLTNDYNLNKVAKLHNIKVYNINELANAMKPIFISGEDITVSVIKEGKEKNQGIGYLDDGTMIVVENGKDYIGHVIDCVVTSVLQNSAGKMIFAKKKD